MAPARRGPRRQEQRKVRKKRGRETVNSKASPSHFRIIACLSTSPTTVTRAWETARAFSGFFPFSDVYVSTYSRRAEIGFKVPPCQADERHDSPARTSVCAGDGCRWDGFWPPRGAVSRVVSTRRLPFLPIRSWLARNRYSPCRN